MLCDDRGRRSTAMTRSTAQSCSCCCRQLVSCHGFLSSLYSSLMPGNIRIRSAFSGFHNHTISCHCHHALACVGLHVGHAAMHGVQAAWRVVSWKGSTPFLGVFGSSTMFCCVLLHTGCRTVAVAGVTTNLCCDSTARAAFMNDFDVW